MSTSRSACAYTVLTLVALTVSAHATEDVAPEVLERVFAASPDSTSGGSISHFPVPMVYAEWEAEVTERYGRFSLAQANRHLYFDLPPTKAEDEAVPVNAAIAKLLENDSKAAVPVLVAALRADPSKPQWSVCAASDQVSDEAIVDSLVKVATSDPSPTDRAWALKSLARRGGPAAIEALRSGLLDDSLSVRLIAVHGLAKTGQRLGDVAALSPVAPRNPFHALFLEEAAKRLLPEQDPQAFLKLPWDERRDLVESADATLLADHLKWLRRNATRPTAALHLWLLGEDEDVAQALGVIEKLLLAHGSAPDTFMGDRFWQRGDVIDVLRGTRGPDWSAVASLLESHVESFSVEKSHLVVTLSYALAQSGETEAVPALAKVRDLETPIPDTYLGAAMALAGLRDAEAFPSLLHVLSLGEEPFGSQAVASLEELTGVETPDKPKDVGALGNLGLPQEPLDVAKAHAFWSNWWTRARNRLVFDETTGRFAVGEAAPAPPFADLERWSAATQQERRDAARSVADAVSDLELRGLETFECGGAKHEIAVFTHAATGLEFVLVPGGVFTMGSPETEAGRYPEEASHDVELSPYLISRTEVTRAAWQRVTGDAAPGEGAEDLPISHASAVAATAFAKQAGCSLPSEAQWERACRAGTTSTYFFGDDPETLGDYAWFKGNSDNASHGVAGKRPNAFGLYDMLGSLLEWARDGYRGYKIPAPRDPLGASRADGWVPVRGGSMTGEPVQLRCAFRFGMKDDNSYDIVGFRLVLEIAR